MITEDDIKLIRQIVLDVIHEQKKFEKEQDEDDDWEDDRDYDDEDDFDEHDTRYNCKCGAWIVGNSGQLLHVADCCCGAE